MNMQVSKTPKPMQHAPVSLLDVLDVRSLPGDDRFVGIPGEYPMSLLYGGHLLGQAVAAALRTVTDDFAANSLHALFLRAGELNVPIEYQVTRLRDGRRYVTRLIEAFQHGKLMLTMTLSAKLPEAGDEHQPVMPVVRSAQELVAEREAAGIEVRALPMSSYGLQIESLDGFHPASPDFGKPCIAQWLGVKQVAQASLHIRQAALAYVSDGTMMFNALRPYGSIASSHAATSLDHALWFHHEVDFAHWILFDQSSPTATDTRGLNHAHMFAQDGKLIATVMQESMLKRLST